jgi:hypothetical protein
MKHSHDNLKERKCRELFRQIRIKEGLTCKKCTGEKHYWISTKWQWECAKCRFRTTLTSGTILENTKLPIWVWFSCLTFLFSKEEGISAREIQLKVGFKRYEPIWALLHKIRKRMGESEELKLLYRSVETHLGKIRTYLPMNDHVHRTYISLVVYKDMKQSLFRLQMVNFLDVSRASPKLVSPRPNGTSFIHEDEYSHHAILNPRLKFIINKLKDKVFRIHHGVQCDYLNNYVVEQSYFENYFGKNPVGRTFNIMVQYFRQSSG